MNAVFKLNKLCTTRLFLPAFAMIVISCGGSGSSTPPPPPPPPPTSNNAPIVTTTTSSGVIDEGQKTTLDASSTTDQENDTLSFSWTQTAGTLAVILSPSEATTEIISPEITVDETATFRITVSDGTNQVSEDVDVSFSNIFQSPQVDFTLGDFASVMTAPDVSIADNLSGDRRLTSYVTVPNGSAVDDDLLALTFDLDTNSVTSSVVPNIVIPKSRVIGPQGATSSPFTYDRLDNVVLDTNSHTASILRIGEDIEEVAGNFTGADYCHVSEIIVPFAYDNILPAAHAEFPYVVIMGKENGGLDILSPQFDTPQDTTDTPQAIGSKIYQSLGTTESFCFIKYQFSFFNPASDGDFSVLDGIIFAVDYDAQTISLLLDKTSTPLNGRSVAELAEGINPNYQIVETVPLQTESDTALEIIGVVDEFSAFGGFFILMSDNKHDGEHRVISVNVSPKLNGTEPTNEIEVSQTTLSWSKGVPQNGTLMQIYDDEPRSLIINSSTSPEAIVFKPTDFGSRMFSGPNYLELGLGAGDVDRVSLRNVVETENGRGTDSGLVITHPETGEVKVLIPR